MSTNQLPGATTRTPDSIHKPPWDRKTVVAPRGYEGSEISWVSISYISPKQTRKTTEGRRMVHPDPYVYPALVLGARGTPSENKLQDGHHRYYHLLDRQWRGQVPVVRKPGPRP